MKRLLSLTITLALVGGTSLAEITISGDAKLGLDYNSEPGDMKSKHEFKHEMGVDFSGSGTTDGGLSFGGSAGFDTGDTTVNTGTVFVSGSFGKITIGDNTAADGLAGGIADVGMNGIGVDDVAEDIYTTSPAQFRYDHSVGNISLALSAGTQKGAMAKANVSTEFGTLEAKKNGYALGMAFNAGGATVGIGYDSKKTISAGLGYSTGQIAVNALYAKRDQSYRHGDSADGVNTVAANNETATASYKGLGMDVSYTMGASKLTLVYAKTNVSNIQPVWDATATEFKFTNASFKGLGLGFSHDLGGGASLVAGFGQVPKDAVGDLGMEEIGQLGARQDLSAKVNKASVGLTFAF